MSKSLSHITLAVLFLLASCGTQWTAAAGPRGGGGGLGDGGGGLKGGGADAKKNHSFSGNSGPNKSAGSFSGQSVRQTQSDQGFRANDSVKINSNKDININANKNVNNNVNINTNNNNNRNNNNSRGVAVIGDDRGVIAGNNGGVAWGNNGGAVWGNKRGVIAGDNGAIAIGPHGAVVVTDNNRGHFGNDHFYVAGGSRWVYDVDWHGYGVFHDHDDYWKFVAGTTAILALGVMFATLPDNSDTVIIQGDTYYYNNNTYYQQVADQGEMAYVVVMPIGATVTVLPPECSTISVNNVTYHVTPDESTYYMARSGGYIVVVKPGA